MMYALRETVFANIGCIGWIVLTKSVTVHYSHARAAASTPACM
jgi:hypothetical protein